MQERKSFTVESWCLARGMSRSMFYKISKAGIGPRLHYVGSKPLISPDADDEWIRQREAEALEAGHV